MRTAITPTREENYNEWFHEVIHNAELADNSPVRGCIVIRPWGAAIWDRIKNILDSKIKETGHENAYFPLLIPLSFIQKEADHVEGFAKECAIVTHSKLESDGSGCLKLGGKLEDPLVIRPTSETIIGEMFSKWINSYRDLPLLINQWANVVRWEMRTRPFLRTSEFLWQEGHTAHATKKEALEEATKMLNVYKNLSENVLAIKSIVGQKTASERFPGADISFCIEGLMQDKKALQMGTSHYLGQNFSKSFGIQFNNIEGQLKHVYTTSWGVSTRLIGACIMAHSDDDGLVLPPALAPIQVVIIPLHRDRDDQKVIDYIKNIKHIIKTAESLGEQIRVEIDFKDVSGGDKKWKWIKKGVPLLIEIGINEVDKQGVCVIKRDLPRNKSLFISQADIKTFISEFLENRQSELLAKSSDFTQSNITEITTRKEFYDFFNNKSAGLALCHWSENEEAENEIKKSLKVTARCIPLSENDVSGLCFFTGNKTNFKALFGRAY